MKYLKISLVIGFLSVVFSLNMSPYTDETKFFSLYGEMGVGQSKEYFQLRDEMLTPKYRVLDIGITIILFSIVLTFLLKAGGGVIKTPKPNYVLVLLALSLPFITSGGYVFDLIQGLYRNEFPRWADSLGIPFAGVPFIFGLLLFWSTFHLVFVHNSPTESVEVSKIFSKKCNFWLFFLAIISFLMMLVTVYYGQYWYAIPSAFWLYYYLSLGAIRCNTNEVSNKAN